MLGFASAFGGATALRAPTAFAGCRVAAPAAPAAARWTMVKSKAVPFLDAPPALDGSMVGDVGFDPLGFSNYIDLKFLREAEIKHCRVTMLAVLGLFVQEFYTLPFYAGGPALAEPAHNYFVSQGAMQQLLLWICGLEIIVGVPAVLQMMQGSGRRPGEFGFDPLNFAKSNAAFDKFQNAELVNGRLTMIAIGGLIHQQWMTQCTPVQQILSGKLFP